MTGFKVLTHDFCSPLQGGSAIWDGKTLPFTLPAVTLDTGHDECAPGWNYCQDLATAASIAGFWLTGRPAVGLEVEPAPDGIERGNKRRASSLTLLRQATPQEWEGAIRALSAKWFDDKADLMAKEQIAWFVALRRPLRDPAVVEAALRQALDARGLNWTLRQFPNARDARSAWDAWSARSARSAWSAWSAWSAREGLTVTFAAEQRWISQRGDLLTVGIRDAYHHGLEIALPTGPNELGWAMAD